MSDPYIGEIRMFAGSFAPAGWAFCDGQLMPISENDALFTLIGTTYGGDGEETFALPDLQGRIPLHQGNGFTLAEKAGTESVALTVQQIPIHAHVPLAASGAGNQSTPENNFWAATQSGTPCYADAPNAQGAEVPMHNQLITGAGGNQPHENMAPFLVISFIISLFGRFPSPI